MSARKKARPAAAGRAQKFLAEVVFPYQGDECLIWPFNRSGYARLISSRKSGRSALVSRLVCEAENGPPPSPKHHAAHSCGNGTKGCVSRRHLSWKTPKENSDDKILHGTHNRGERNGRAKLSATQVREILSLKGALAQRAIARRFGVSHGYVSRIHNRKYWTYVDSHGAVLP